jgi:hypothetical protein
MKSRRASSNAVDERSIAGISHDTSAVRRTGDEARRSERGPGADPSTTLMLPRLIAQIAHGEKIPQEIVD